MERDIDRHIALMEAVDLFARAGDRDPEGCLREARKVLPDATLEEVMAVYDSLRQEIEFHLAATIAIRMRPEDKH